MLLSFLFALPVLLVSVRLGFDEFSGGGGRFGLISRGGVRPDLGNSNRLARDCLVAPEVVVASTRTSSSVYRGAAPLIFDNGQWDSAGEGGGGAPSI